MNSTGKTFLTHTHTTKQTGKNRHTSKHTTENNDNEQTSTERRPHKSLHSNAKPGRWDQKRLLIFGSQRDRACSTNGSHKSCPCDRNMGPSKVHRIHSFMCDRRACSKNVSNQSDWKRRNLNSKCCHKCGSEGYACVMFVKKHGVWCQTPNV